MIITVDIGNSHQIFHLYQDEELVGQGELINLLPTLERKEIDLKDTQTIVSSVCDEHLDQINLDYIKAKDFLINGMFLDMPIHYSFMLGEDRLVEAYYLYKTRELPCLLIDSGTFTTIDYITKDGFKGGHILPGLTTIKNCYHHGDKLKGISIEDNSSLHTQTPQHSYEAIEQGMLASYFYPIEHIVTKNYDVSHIVTSGGNAKFVSEHLHKSGQEVELRANLLHEALRFLAGRLH